MKHYILQRILLLPPLIVVISLMAFLLVRLAPGSPFQKERSLSPQVEEALNEKYGLNKPLLVQYLNFMSGVVQGDFGPSLKYRSHTVNDIIRQGLPVSLTLGLLAFALAQGIGIPVGFLTAVRKGGAADYWGSFAALLAVCIPAFVVGPLLMMIFAIHLRWFPTGLWGTPWHAVLPTVSLGLYFAGKVSRLMREGMLEALTMPCMVTARAKGLRERDILLKHAFRMAVLPVVSYSGPLLADLLVGSFVVESIFQIPGIGVFLVNSSLNRDYTMVVGLVILYASMLLVLNLLVDLSYHWLDPRVKND